MKIGYMRVSKADGTQVLDLQQDALVAAGVLPENIYSDFASGAKDGRLGLESCLRSLRAGDTLLVYKLDRLGRSLRHLINTVLALQERGVHFKVLSGQGADIDTSTAAGRMIFGIFATLADYERELIRERTYAGLKAARARGRVGGRKPALTKHEVRLVQIQMADKHVNVTELCKQLNISRATLYRYVSPLGELREQGLKIIDDVKQ